MFKYHLSVLLVERNAPCDRDSEPEVVAIHFAIPTIDRVVKWRITLLVLSVDVRAMIKQHLDTFVIPENAAQHKVPPSSPRASEISIQLPPTMPNTRTAPATDGRKEHAE